MIVILLDYLMEKFRAVRVKYSSGVLDHDSRQAGNTPIENI